MQVPDFQKLFDALPGAHMVLDRDLRYVAVNPAYERATLRRRDELLGRPLFDMFPNEGESGQRLRASFDRVLQTRRGDTLAYIPYDIPKPDEDGRFDIRYWTVSHSPVLDDQGDVAFIIQNTVDVTDLVRLREAAALPFRARSGAPELVERAREVEEAHQRLLAESEDFRRLFQQAPGFIAVLSGPDHVFSFVNDAYQELVGKRDLVGRPVADALPEVVDQGFVEMLDEVFRRGVDKGGQAQSVHLKRRPDEALEERFIDFSYAPIRDEDGQVTGVFVQGMDRTEATLGQQRQALLLAEVNHRVKNTLATVQSIASHTLKAANDTSTARRDLEARIVALSRTHDLLSERQWSDTCLLSLAENEFAAFGTERARAEGPEVMLAPKAAIAISMVIHELTTNAAKHGGLSVPGGSVAMRWALEEGAEGTFLAIDWHEEGGPKKAGPARDGFGSRMIERLVTGELVGTLERDYAAKGFRCRISIPEASFRRVGQQDE